MGIHETIVEQKCGLGMWTGFAVIIAAAITCMTQFIQNPRGLEINHAYPGCLMSSSTTRARTDSSLWNC